MPIISQYCKRQKTNKKASWWFWCHWSHFKNTDLSNIFMKVANNCNCLFNSHIKLSTYTELLVHKNPKIFFCWIQLHLPYSLLLQFIIVAKYRTLCISLLIFILLRWHFLLVWGNCKFSFCYIIYIFHKVDKHTFYLYPSHRPKCCTTRTKIKE